MPKINAELRQALIEVFPPTAVDQALEKIGIDGGVRDLRKELEFDSIDEIEFIMALEEGFGIEISDDEVENILNSKMTIGQLQEVLQSKAAG